jgi:hypothetical protein
VRTTSWIIVTAFVLVQVGCKRPEHEADAADRMIEPPTVATPPSAETRTIESDDPNKPAVEAKIEAIRAGQKAGGHSEARLSQVADVVTPTLQSVFHGCRFYFVQWSMVPAPTAAATREAVARAFGLAVTFVIDEDKELTELNGSGNLEEFGRLLAKRQAVIASAEDASIIWSAFCDAYRKQWKARAPRRVSETQWALGEAEIRGTRYWYDVRLAPDHRVRSAIFRSASIGG